MSQHGANDLVDLRTDFVSRPTEAMIEAMTAAARARPGFDLKEDPIQLELEAASAALLGHEDALLCPTCAMANQIALHIHGRPGWSVVAEASAHIFTSEAGATTALSGLNPKLVPSRLGLLDPAAVDEAIRQVAGQRMPAALVELENTQVRTGGTVMPEATMAAIRKVADGHGIPLHFDGSRIFNAAVALGISARDLARHGTSVSFSLNKGLGTPLGAMLVGSKAFIEQAVRVRQMFGGGWRPAGIPAAAGLVALRTMIDRLADDHVNARRLADGLSKLDGIAIDPEQVQTNIVLVKVTRPGLDVPTLLAAVKARGALGIPFAPQVIRLVTYHNIGPAEVDRAVAAFAGALAA